MSTRIIILRFSMIVCLTTLVPACQAQEESLTFNLIHSGTVDHRSLGRGVYARVVPEPMPTGGLEDPIILTALDEICDEITKLVVPLVHQNMGFSGAIFLQVQIAEADTQRGRLLYRTYAIEDDRCDSVMVGPTDERASIRLPDASGNH